MGGGLGFGDTEGQIEHALEFPGAVGQTVVARPHVIARAEIFVGDVERCQDRDLQTVALRTFPHRQAHLFIDVSRQLCDVRLLERASYRIPLAVDFYMHNARFNHTLVVSRQSTVDSH